MDRKESNRIYIAVDSTKVARCKWSGITESKNWIGSDSGGVYCSDECRSASNALCSPIFLSFYLFILYVVLSQTIHDLAGAFFLFCIFLTSVIACFACYVPSLKYRKQVPKDSRSHDVPLEVAILKAMSSSVLCPQCNANIDVRKVNSDRAYTCDYCGASGIIEVVKTK